MKSVAKGVMLICALMLLGGCGTYVKRADFEAAMKNLESKDADLSNRVNATEQQLKDHRHE